MVNLKSKDWYLKEEERGKNEEEDRTQSDIQRRRPCEDESETRVMSS